jgi:hypothetical protein
LSHVFLCLLNILPEEIVSRVDTSFCFLDNKIPKKKSVGLKGQFLPKIYDPHDGDEDEVNLGHSYACLLGLNVLSMPKGEALIPIMVLTFCGFNSCSGFKLVAQDLIGWTLFNNCIKFEEFKDLQHNSSINVTLEARKYLHGHYVKDMVGLCKEAFLKFTCVTYHHDLLFLSRKYSPQIRALKSFIADFA